MQPTEISAISAMVAPVVLITTGGMLSNGMLQIYTAVNDRMRELNQEYRHILTGPDGTPRAFAQLSPIDAERATEIRRQLPLLLRRHRLVHNSIVLIYGGLAFLVLSVIAIAVAVTEDATGFAIAALVLVLAGTVVILGGVVQAAQSHAMSKNAIEYEVSRTLSLGAEQ